MSLSCLRLLGLIYIYIYIYIYYIIIFLSQIYISTLNILTQLENITFITKM